MKLNKRTLLRAPIFLIRRPHTINIILLICLFICFTKLGHAVEFFCLDSVETLSEKRLFLLKKMGYDSLRLRIPVISPKETEDAAFKNAQKIRQLYFSLQKNITTQKTPTRLVLDFTSWETQNADAILKWLKQTFPSDSDKTAFHSSTHELSGLVVAVGNFPFINWQITDPDTQKKIWNRFWTDVHKDQFSLHFGYTLQHFSQNLFDNPQENLSPAALDLRQRVRNDTEQLLMKIYFEKFLTPIWEWCLPRDIRLQFCFSSSTYGTENRTINRPVKNLLQQMDASRKCNEMCAFDFHCLPFAWSAACLEGRKHVFFLSESGNFPEIFFKNFGTHWISTDENLKNNLSRQKAKTFWERPLGPGFTNRAVLVENDLSYYFTMRQAGIPCYIITQNMLARATVTRISSEKTVLELGPTENTLLTLSHLSTLTPEAAEMIERFVRLGGKILINTTSSSTDESVLPITSGSLARWENQDARVQEAVTRIQNSLNSPQKKEIR
ncbi:MAG: hypothetical protein Q4C96_05815 [Planctomycetia bacterium]|nr:hypothetical protein [Planctomycetia bacterium]